MQRMIYRRSTLDFVCIGGRSQGMPWKSYQQWASHPKHHSKALTRKWRGIWCISCVSDIKKENLLNMQVSAISMAKWKVRRTKVRAAPFVFFSPPSSKLWSVCSQETGRWKRRQWTYCLQRLRDNCILYLHTVHSNRSTTFFVVFACKRPRRELNASEW